MLHIDGTEGEGGGQVLRTALTLSLLTGTPIHLDGIRGRRKNPGLQRQHLTCVQAATDIGAADVHGAAIGSTALTFAPQGIRAGSYTFSVGTAGSTTLVLQTVLPALLRANATSTVVINGGTHNPMAPPFDFVQRAYAPALQGMGANIELQLLRHGFYPVGGGMLSATIEPAYQLRPLQLLERRNPRPWRARVLMSKLPTEIGERELDHLLSRLSRTHLSFDDTALERVDAEDPANVLLLELPHDTLCEVLCAFGERGVPAEQLADRIATEALMLGSADVPVGPYLADQLLVPMALAGSGAFRSVRPTLHCTTNARLIERFLPVGFTFTEVANRPGTWQVDCSTRS